MTNSQLIVHIPDEPPHDLHHQPTVTVFASFINPKHANQIVRRLNQIAPLEGLRHVKRIRKKVLEEGGQIELSVVLCLAYEGDNQLDAVPPHLQEFISSYQLSPFITKVCKYEAISKEEWQEQCKFWPTSYHPRTYIDGITGFSEEDSQSVLKFMQSAVELATSGGSVNVVNAAVIVDPSAKQIISTARDQVFAWNTCKDDSCCNKPDLLSSHPIANSLDPQKPLHLRSSCNHLKQSYTGVACLCPWQWAEQQSNSQSSYYCHPLRHAAIVAIESSAARDRRLFPNDEGSKEKYLELDHESPCSSSPSKRQKTVGATVEDDGKLNAQSQTSNQVEDNDKLNPHSQTESNLLSARPYLCTGYDIYLVWEPCTMCAMALVHQRIRRIFYAFPNPKTGALGSVYRLQGEKSLNHHYAVFRVLLPEEALHNRSAAETEETGI
ncbi:tRNA-specific adenosine deaminase TAD3-like isoform X2 [Trifolium pratense]|uniref:tRNA-specific adenosine deaminase TAD3-like isoform X2 n=1 Tax=Trifolium pratense TaxID=57577 RepID=UPI001E690E68|nr:tRNA-specific adenosine deaminase TAD3-like isoform X2 [Trifolium pratense]